MSYTTCYLFNNYVVFGYMFLTILLFMSGLTQHKYDPPTQIATPKLVCSQSKFIIIFNCLV